MRTLPKVIQSYDEFEVVISAGGQPGVFQARASSTAGFGANEFRMPVPPAEWPTLRRQLAQLVVRNSDTGVFQAQTSATAAGEVSRGANDLGDDGKPVAAISYREFGVELFKALFTGELGSLFSQARSIALDSKKAGIRLRLTFSFPDESAERFTDVMNLPWELMQPSVHENPIVVDSRSPLVRSFNRKLNDLQIIEPPIRLLVIYANPKGTQELAVQKEVERMKLQWSKAPAVQFRSRAAHLEDVEQELDEFKPHIVHFIGHGDITDGQGVLLFEGKDGAEEMDAKELAGLLNRDDLRLVYLNSCRGAEVGSDEDSSPFGGVATSLAKNGIPAVIAMQFPVTDKTAVEFCDWFYSYLVKGYPIDAAVGAARLKVFTRGKREWATPVLFLREDDAQLIRKASAAQVKELAPFQKQGIVEVLLPDPPESDGLESDTSPDGNDDDAEEDFVVFLASATKSVDTWILRAQSDMLRLGWTVIRPKDPSWEDYDQLFPHLTRCCHLFVHIVGPRPGDEISGVPGSETPFHSVRQFDIAFKSAASQLVIFPQGTPRRVDDPKLDPHLAKMVETIEVSTREPSQFESIECDIERLGQHLQSHYHLIRQTELEAAGAVNASSSAVFVDVHDTDIDAARPFLVMLDGLGVPYVLSQTVATAVDKPAATVKATDSLKEFDELVQQVPLMIVLAGAVNPAWVQGRLRQGLRAAGRHDPPTNLAVLRLPGNTVVPPMPAYARLFGDDKGFSEQSVTELLALRFA